MGKKICIIQILWMHYLFVNLVQSIWRMLLLLLLLFYFFYYYSSLNCRWDSSTLSLSGTRSYSDRSVYSPKRKVLFIYTMLTCFLCESSCGKLPMDFQFCVNIRIFLFPVQRNVKSSSVVIVPTLNVLWIEIRLKHAEISFITFQRIVAFKNFCSLFPLQVKTSYGRHRWTWTSPRGAVWWWVCCHHAAAPLLLWAPRWPPLTCPLHLHPKSLISPPLHLQKKPPHPPLLHQGEFRVQLIQLF